MNLILSEREMQIAKECCKGKSSRVIADEIGISKRTIDSHKAHIYRKLGIKNNVELIHKLYNLK
jgi:two-component system response regulator DctR